MNEIFKSDADRPISKEGELDAGVDEYNAERKVVKKMVNPAEAYNEWLCSVRYK